MNFLCLVKQYIINKYGVWLLILLTWILDRGEWSASRLGRVNPGEGTPRYPSDRRKLGGPQSRSGQCGEVSFTVLNLSLVNLSELRQGLLSRCSNYATSYPADVQFSAGARGFFLRYVQTSTGTHPSSYTASTRGGFPGSKEVWA
jgi:hypothetical protein